MIAAPGSRLYIAAMDFFNQQPAQPTDPRQNGSSRPLADRMRPRSLDEFVGQEEVVGPGTSLRKAIESDTVSSLIFWGPPGSGKTTLAEVIARSTHGQFVRFSAVTSSIKEVKEIISKAGHYYQMSGRRTYIFVDEIHRFNKAQQDAFLPYVEKGDIVLVGATTENPSFEINSALLSRMRVYVLQRLSPAALEEIIRRALDDPERGLGGMNLTADDPLPAAIAAAADGDARRGLTLLEAIATYTGADTHLTLDHLKAVAGKKTAVYDKSGEEHFNLISALHKSIRGGDPDASMYWLARMLDGGEDPMYIIRRLVRAAVEDIGLADSYALTLALNTRDAFHFLGSPEGDLVIAQLVVYLACAPKSNSMYVGYKKALRDAEEHGSLPVPLWLRNAPTDLMKELGYGKDYQYAHDYDEALTDQNHLPDQLADCHYFEPKEVGREARFKEYADKFRAWRADRKKS